MSVIEKKPDNPLLQGVNFPPPGARSEPVGATPADSWFTVADRIKQKFGVEITAEQLIEFNFKLKRGESNFAAKVNYYLRTLVGCTRTTADGKNYLFHGAKPGLIYFPAAAPPVKGAHVIIIGGVSVNDKASPPHDRFPYNFINPAMRRAKEFKEKENVYVLMFTPSYEVRVRDQVTEHASVTIPLVPDSCDLSTWRGRVAHAFHDDKKDPDHFLNVVRKAATGMHLVTFRSASQLTTELNNIEKIETIHYYGHSNKKELLLNYAIDGNPTASERWAKRNAEAVPASKFTSGASFVTCGCHQGEDRGLAEELRDLWKIQTLGAEGKTDYESVGRGTVYPDAPGKYYLFPAPELESDGSLKRPLPSKKETDPF